MIDLGIRGNFRSDMMLKFASSAPCCMACGVHNHGQVVGAHSNSQLHGKGMGIKAHDLVAYLCNDCHDDYDGRSDAGMTRDDASVMFLNAVYFSVLWLLHSGRLVAQ